jgi:hypothetical protein
VGFLAGAWLHETFPTLHLALVLTLGIITTFTFLSLIRKVAVLFWLWTTTLAGIAGYIILRDVQDKGWASFLATVAVLLIVVIHHNSRNPPAEDAREFLVEEDDLPNS